MCDGIGSNTIRGGRVQSIPAAGHEYRGRDGEALLAHLQYRQGWNLPPTDT
jgi:hypothetical protein